jgi:cell division ATPase FtsA
VISARYEQIFTQINKQLRKIDRDGRLPGGILLIGWGAKMQNCDQCAKEIFKLATFYGKEYQMGLWELSSNLQFINTIGGYLRTTKYNEAKSGFFGFNFSFGSWIFQPITNFFKKLF